MNQSTRSGIFIKYLKQTALLLTVLLFCEYTAPLQASDKHTNSLEPVSEDRDSLKLEKLFKQTRYFGNVKNDLYAADSLASLAIEVATSTYKPTLLLKAYLNYLDNVDQSSKRALSFAQQAEKMNPGVKEQELDWNCCLSLAEVYKTQGYHEKSLILAYQSLTLANEMNDKIKSARSYLAIGRSLEKNNQKVEAFRNFLMATRIAEQLENFELQLQCYSNLSDFYLNSKIYDKATSYKLLEENLLLSKKSVDSISLMWIRYDLQVINYNSDSPGINKELVDEILDFAVRHKLERLRTFEFTVYRSILTKLNRIDLLREFYTKSYPHEFARLKQTSPSFYLRLLAYFKEKEQQYDSAVYYFELARKAIETNHNKFIRSNFHYRYGEFLVRRNNIAQAVSELTLAYKLAEESDYIDFMLKPAIILEDLYAQEKKFEEAYFYASKSRTMNDSIASVNKKEQLLILEINHEARQQELAYEREQQLTIRRHNLQYTAIIITILTVFVILILLGSFKVPRWVIQWLGFISFIFLFEFIILIADQKIHHLTHGEPWKILLIKIALIAILLPFHHWIEHRVVHHLISHRLIKFETFSLSAVFKLKTKEHDEKKTEE